MNILSLLRRLFPVTIVVVSTLLALQASIQNPFYTSHDGFLHLARMAAYYQSLEDGQFPPRWATGLNGNMGSPIFVFIYPLPYLLGALTHFLGLTYINSYQFWTVAGTVISAIAMYAWLRQSFDRVASMVGAIAYVWVPYRFLNLYVRGAFAENLAFTLPPLVLLCLGNLLSRKRKLLWWSLFSLSLAALLLMHSQIAALALPLIIGFGTIQMIIARDKKIVVPVVLALVTSFLLASFVYLPDLFERSLVNFDNSFFFYKDYFVTPWQLVSSPWGFGFDLPGTIHDEMSFKIGQTQIAAMFGSAVLISWQLVKRKKTLAVAAPLLFLLASLGALFLMVESLLGKLIWEYLPIIKTIVDYPWRLFFVVVFSGSFLLAFVLSRLSFKYLMATVAIVFLIISNRNHTRINLPQSFTNKQIESYRGSATAATNEYKPRVHVNETFVERQSAVEAVRGEVFVSGVWQSALGLGFTTRATMSGLVRINRFYFPETIIKRSSQTLELGQDYFVITPGKTVPDNDTGLINLLVVPGESRYTLSFEDSKIRKVGNILSLITVLGLGSILAFELARWGFSKRV